MKKGEETLLSQPPTPNPRSRGKGLGISLSLILISCFALASGCAHKPSSTSPNYEITHGIYYKNSEDASLKRYPREYLLLDYPEKKKGKRYPLIVIFHGAGQPNSAYLDIWKEDAAKHGYLVLAPRWGQYLPKDLQAVIDRLVKENQADSSHIYFAGVSAGALQARSLVVDNKLSVQGLILTASPPELYWIAHQDISDLPPVLYLHGGKDPQFKVEDIQRDVDALKAKGKRVDFILDPDAGHEHRMQWNDSIFQWLKKIRK